MSKKSPHMVKSDLKIYFAERFVELLDMGTPDSYRVRNNNVISLLEELSNLISGWSNNQIKQFETVQLCIDETVSSLNRDMCFDDSSYDRELFISDLKDYASTAKTKETKDDKVTITASLLNSSSRVSYLINNYLISNHASYIQNSFKFIEGIILSDAILEDTSYPEVLLQLDLAISNLACQLIHSGFSKSKLYFIAKQLLDNVSSFDKEYHVFKETLLSPRENKYIVVYRIPTNKDIDSFANDFSLLDDVDDIVKDIKPSAETKRCINYLTPTSGVKFFKVQLPAFDHYSAIKKANEVASKLLDTISFGMKRKKLFIPNDVAILSYKGKDIKASIRDTDKKLDGSSDNRLDVSASLKQQLDIIINNAYVKQETKDRLTSALRHIRFGNNTAEIELKFINYWIALEFIFSSPATNENTFGRIKKHLSNVLCACYIKRNVMFLDSSMKKAKIIKEDENLWDMNEKQWGELIDKETSQLRQYRLCRLKSHLRSSDAIKEYLNNHKTTLEQHLSRIYRMRNELIHEAAINQDIEAVTSNLRYYLTFLISQLVDFLAKVPTDNMEVSIDDFFFEYESKIKTIEKGWDRETVLSVSFIANML